MGPANHDSLLRVSEQVAHIHEDLHIFVDRTQKQVDELTREIKEIQSWRGKMVGVFGTMMVVIPAGISTLISKLMGRE